MGLSFTSTRRRLGRIAAAVAMVIATAGAATVVSVTPAHAGDRNIPVFMVHGFSRNSGHNCAGYWGDQVQTLLQRSFPNLATVKYYDGDYNCTHDIRNAAPNDLTLVNNVNKPIGEHGRDLAWWIYNNYSRHNRYVYLVGHSMGGLIIRDAIGRSGDPNWAGDYPPQLLVSATVTLATPYSGSLTAGGCDVALNYLQCRQMSPGSPFITSQPTRVGTGKWLSIGSNGDLVATCASATAFGQTRVCYANPAYDHGNILHDRSFLPDAVMNGGWTWFHSLRGVAEWFEKA